MQRQLLSTELPVLWLARTKLPTTWAMSNMQFGQLQTFGNPRDSSLKSMDLKWIISTQNLHLTCGMTTVFHVGFWGFDFAVLVRLYVTSCRWSLSKDIAWIGRSSFFTLVPLSLYSCTLWQIEASGPLLIILLRSYSPYTSPLQRVLSQALQQSRTKSCLKVAQSA